jgi:hypothetical protein
MTALPPPRQELIDELAADVAGLLPRPSSQLLRQAT